MYLEAACYFYYFAETRHFGKMMLTTCLVYNHPTEVDIYLSMSLCTALNIQLTSEELQALFGILQQRSSAPSSTPSLTTVSPTVASPQTQHHHHSQDHSQVRPPSPSLEVTCSVCMCVIVLSLYNFCRL